MPDMVSAYIRMCAEQEMPSRPRSENARVDEVYEIQVVDMFQTSSVDVTLDAQAKGIAPALLLAQLVPCAPWRPTVAIKVRVLEAYRVLHVRSPQLAIQLFVKSLCDLHGRVLRREKLPLTDETGEPMVGKSRERVDNRDAGDGYYTSRQRVERWVRDRVADRLPMQSEEPGEDNPCADCWKNMINDVTSKMWGIFDETGIFLALCRHGFVLVIADMIRSGGIVRPSADSPWPVADNG
ncbi:hypothetical protein B0H14DRAFT_2587381 [Mycena olivaceomarginata]|nr:hypothetical protein B0H14DRAFT_2587381 [Mycena olivaceomarginata]